MFIFKGGFIVGPGALGTYPTVQAFTLFIFAYAFKTSPTPLNGSTKPLTPHSLKRPNLQERLKNTRILRLQVPRAGADPLLTIP
jgi:hypothetical protein